MKQYETGAVFPSEITARRFISSIAAFLAMPSPPRLRYLARGAAADALVGKPPSWVTSWV